MGDRDYILDDQVGFLLRKANQRHTAIFARRMGPDLTPTQFAALVRVAEAGPVSQNELGRQTAMDAATIKGVIDRLAERGLVRSGPDPADRRRVVIELTEEGARRAEAAIAIAREITRETLEPLSGRERQALLPLLRKVGQLGDP